VRNALAITANMGELSRAYDQLKNRGPGVPGIGVLVGYTGAGKTTAIDWLVGQTAAVYVRAMRSWSLNTMLGAICIEFHSSRLTRNADMVEFICEQSFRNRRPIFIDEADHLFKHPDMLETVRDIYDTSKQPVFLVGMDDFERKLVHRKQFARRVLQWVRFKPLTFDDTRLYVNAVCEVEVADDLVAKVLELTGGSIGHMAVAVALIEIHAKDQGWDTITAKQWGDRQMVFTKPPREPK